MAKAGRVGPRRLTKRAVEGLGAPETGSVVVGDSEVPGFCVRVHRGSTRVWRAYVYRYTQRGGTGERYITLGEHGAPWTDRTGKAGTLTCEIARELARRLRGVRNAGGDPKEAHRPTPPQARAEVPSLESFSADYLAKHTDVHKRPASRKQDRTYLRLYILKWLGKARLDEIGPDELAGFQARMKHAPTCANRCLGLLSHMFTMARRWRVLPQDHANPCRDVPRFRERMHERFLTPEELGRLGPALILEETRDARAVACIRLLMFTGARPAEIVSLKREDLGQLDAGVIVLQESKTGQRILRLSDEAVAVARTALALPRRYEQNPWLFPMLPSKSRARAKSEHVTVGQVGHVWARVKLAAGVEDVRLYDLRHTFASVALAGGASLEFIGGLLGHLTPLTTKRYAHLARAADPIRKVGEAASAEIAEALKGKA